MKTAKIAPLLLAVIFGQATGAGPQPAPASPQQTVRLLGTLSGWTYPGSKLLGNATASSQGDPLPSVKMKAILTTPDPVSEVAEFYTQKHPEDRTSGSAGASADEKPADAEAVSVQDDSAGRPVAIRVIVINEAQTSTTLVISRAKGETETHIAWSHCLRVNVK